MELHYLPHKITLTEWEKQANVTVIVEELDSKRLYDQTLKFGAYIKEWANIKDSRRSCIMGSPYALGHTILEALQGLVKNISGGTLTDGYGNYLDVPNLEVPNLVILPL